MNPQEQNELLDSLYRHEPVAQRRLLQEYGDMVYGLIQRMVGNPLDAEEVYQDVFLKALSRIDSYKPSKASIDVWLCRIAYNTSLNHLRRMRRIHQVYALDEESLSDTAEMSEPDSADKETTELLAQALERLEPTDKTLIMMFYYDDMTFSEIAYVMGSNVSTIGSRLFRIRKKLYGIVKRQKTDKVK
ncbi:MAG: sigma-70 family RNA polymerase sigma factor [Bacteroidaceae bacterium]|nr:sigma-70 family RNA polymerase sigma factor [Bacteroidaceae bacterium]